MKCVLHVCRKTGERPVLRRGGCTINCNHDNLVPSAAVTKCARDGRSSVSRRRSATQEADNATDEILKSKLGPFTKERSCERTYPRIAGYA